MSVGKDANPVEEIPKKWVLFFEHLSRQREHFDNLYWKTIDHYTSAINSTLTISVAIITAVATLMSVFEFPPIVKPFTVVVVLLPIVALAMTWVGMKTVKHTYKLHMTWVLMLAKTEKAIGLHEDDVPAKDQLCTAESTLMPPKMRFENDRPETTDKFVESMVNQEKGVNIWGLARRQFYVYIILELLLLSVSFILVIYWLFMLP